MSMGGEGGIRKTHGWSKSNGPGKRFKELIVAEVYNSISTEKQQGKRNTTVDAACKRIWNNDELQSHWLSNRETEIKKTIHDAIIHRRIKLSRKERKDGPQVINSMSVEGSPMPVEGAPAPVEGIPMPIEGVQMPIEFNGHASHHPPGMSNAFFPEPLMARSNYTMPSNYIIYLPPPLPGMTITVVRFNGVKSCDPCELRVMHLVNKDEPYIEDVSCFKLSKLIDILQGVEQGLSFDVNTGAIVRLPLQGLQLSRIKGQLGFEAALQMQLNAKCTHSFELGVCSMECE